jgi:hypothetical protein
MLEAPDLDMDDFNYISSTTVYDNNGNEYQNFKQPKAELTYQSSRFLK